MHPELDSPALLVAKIVLAGVLGGFIGYERESHGQAAGFRTYVLVSMAACLMMLLSMHMSELFQHLGSDSVIRLDPGRIASYAIASMGFLGAGAIIKGKGSVRGLTTAAGLWLVTGVGLSVAAGYFLPAVFTALASAAALFFLPQLVRRFVRRDVYSVMVLTANSPDFSIQQVVDALRNAHWSVQVTAVNYEHDFKTGLRVFTLRVHCKDHVPDETLASLVQSAPGLTHLCWREAEVP